MTIKFYNSLTKKNKNISYNTAILNFQVYQVEVSMPYPLLV